MESRFAFTCCNKWNHANGEALLVTTTRILFTYYESVRWIVPLTNMLFYFLFILFYYESRKWELKTRLIYETRSVWWKTQKLNLRNLHVSPTRVCVIPTSYILKDISFTQADSVCRVAFREPIHQCTHVSEEGVTGKLRAQKHHLSCHTRSLSLLREFITKSRSYSPVSVYYYS
jgi:hypothetical protein